MVCERLKMTTSRKEEREFRTEIKKAQQKANLHVQMFYII